MMTNKKEEKDGFTKGDVFKPLLAGASVAGLFTGIYMTSPAPTNTIYARGGFSGGLIGLGLYSRVRFIYQQDIPRSLACVTMFGGLVGSGVALDVGYCEKKKQWSKMKPWPSAVARGGASGSLVALSLYGIVKSFCMLGEFSAHGRDEW